MERKGWRCWRRLARFGDKGKRLDGIDVRERLFSLQCFHFLDDFDTTRFQYMSMRIMLVLISLYL